LSIVQNNSLLFIKQSIQHNGVQDLPQLNKSNLSSRREEDVCYRPEIVLTLGI